MSARSAIKQTYKIIKKSVLAKKLGISYQSIDHWSVINKFPCSEYNGETNYATQIEKLTKGEVTITDCLGFIPPPQSSSWKK